MFSLEHTDPNGSMGVAADAFHERHRLLPRHSLHGASDGEDVVQDVFEGMCARPDLFDPERGAPLALLHVKTKGRRVDVVRAESARRRREERVARAERGRFDETADVAVGRQIQDAVRRALDRLPEDQRVPITLAYFGDRTYREVAAETEVPEGTVKSRIRDGLRRLRVLLEQEGVTSVALG